MSNTKLIMPLALAAAILSSVYVFYEANKPYIVTKQNEILIQPEGKQNRYCFKLATPQQIEDIKSGKLDMLPCVAMSEKSFYSLRAKLDEHFKSNKSITAERFDIIFKESD